MTLIFAFLRKAKLPEKLNEKRPQKLDENSSRNSKQNSKRLPSPANVGY